MFRPSNPNDKHLANLEYMEWRREQDEKKDDFPFIGLSHKELRLLKKSQKGEVQITGRNRDCAIRLRDLKLGDISITDSPEKGKTEFLVVRGRGSNYLAYIRGIGGKEHRDALRFAITTIIATIAAVAAVAGVLIQLASRQ